MLLSPQLYRRQPQRVVAAATTTWNPSDKNAAITLSNGNLTYSGANNADAGVRSIASRSSGKYYWELTLDAFQNGVAIFAGIASASWGLDHMSSSAQSIGWRDNGKVQQDGSDLATIESWSGGTVLGFALDLDNAKIWFRKDGGNWNNDAGANPATNTNGIAVSGLTGAVYAGGDVGLVGGGATTTITANFGATAFAQTAPSGFGNL